MSGESGDRPAGRLDAKSIVPFPWEGVKTLFASPFRFFRYFEKNRNVRGLRGPESPIPIPKTQSAFHPRAQRSAFRRDARQ